MRRIIAPQVVRIIIPPYMGNAIPHTKNSSLASVITVPELMPTAQMIYSSTYRAIEILTVTGAIYLVVTSCLSALQMYFVHRIPDADIQFVDWSKDEFARGAYSYVPPNVDGCREALARPENDWLFFAGEATDTRFPTTVTGAVRSGQRAAREILKML